MLRKLPKNPQKFWICGTKTPIELTGLGEGYSPVAKSKNISLCGEIIKLSKLIANPRGIIFRLGSNFKMIRWWPPSWIGNAPIPTMHLFSRKMLIALITWVTWPSSWWTMTLFRSLYIAQHSQQLSIIITDSLSLLCCCVPNYFICHFVQNRYPLMTYSPLLTWGIIFLLHSVNLILFTVLLIHFIWHISQSLSPLTPTTIPPVSHWRR